MIDRLIEFSLRNRFIVIALWIGIAIWGVWTMLRAPIDAIPDLSDKQVIVFTDCSGRSPQEVEDQVTHPLTVNLQGLPGVKVVRSSSAFGLSMIFVISPDWNRAQRMAGRPHRGSHSGGLRAGMLKALAGVRWRN